MKPTKILLVVALVCLSFSSCDTLFLSQQKMMDIQKGMTKQQITQMLGNPDYRRFDKDIEEWVFEKADRVLVVTFTNNQVESMNTFPGKSNSEREVYPSQYNYNRPMNQITYESERNEQDFQRLYNEVKNKPFNDDKLSTLRDLVYNKGFTCSQCARFMSIFTFDDEKLAAFNIVAPHVIDWENQDIVLKTFSFITNRDKAKNTIDSFIRNSR